MKPGDKVKVSELEVGDVFKEDYCGSKLKIVNYKYISSLDSEIKIHTGEYDEANVFIYNCNTHNPVVEYVGKGRIKKTLEISDKYLQCPLKQAGLTLIRFSELGPQILGQDDKCICTVDKKCINPDKKDNKRCTLEELEKLNTEYEEDFSCNWT